MTGNSSSQNSSTDWPSAKCKLARCGAQVVGPEAGVELFVAVVVVDAVAEPDALQVDGERLVEVALAVALIVGVDGLDEAADAQVVAPVLVEEYVAALQRCLREVVYQRFLAQGQRLESLDLVAEHLDVGELLVGVLEVVRVGGRKGTGCYDHGEKSCLHYLYRWISICGWVVRDD